MGMKQLYTFSREIVEDLRRDDVPGALAAHDGLKEAYDGLRLALESLKKGQEA